MKPLSRTFRVRTLWLLIGVFVVGAPILIGYSKGYRLDDALSLIETGGIYLHSEVADTTVYINGDFVEANGMFFKNVFKQDLLPNRTYEVWVERPGYQSWTKKLFVRKNLVTEAHVLMLPEEFEWRTIIATTTVALSATSTSSTTTQDVANPEYASLAEYFATDRDQFAVEVASTTYITVKGKRVATTTTLIEYEFPKWLEDFASTTDLHEKSMVREREGMVAWLHEGDLFASWVRESDPPPYYWCSATCTRHIHIDWAEPIVRYEFYPNRSDVVVVSTERGVYAVELDDRPPRNIQPVIEEGVRDFRLENDGTLVLFDGVAYRETQW